jgi:MtrB/PioB family decaheme-associated outer membrane protein
MMRTRAAILTVVLLPALSAAVSAQSPGQQAAPAQAAAQPPAVAPGAFTTERPFGRVSFGFRTDDIDGDEARYFRFRDLRGGPTLDGLRFTRENSRNVFHAEADNAGYRDQRYAGDFERIGRVKASFEWNQIPLNLSRDAQSLYTHTGNGVLSIDDSIQQALQSGTTTIANVFTQQLRPFDLRSQRDIATANVVYSYNRDIDLKFSVKNAKRLGNQVFSFAFGSSPGLNPSIEMGVPLDDRTTDVRGAIEFANARGNLSVGYNTSWFENSIPAVRFDNPLRATDAVGGATGIASGPSAGQASWWPSSTGLSINTVGAYNLPHRTRAMASLSVGRWSQDEALLPPTINTAIEADPLSRSSVGGRADIVAFSAGLTSRPTRDVWLNARYRLYDYNNKTPHFVVERPVIGDWALTNSAVENEPTSFTRSNLDLEGSYSPHRYLSLGAGYAREDQDRTFRIFENTAENTFRVSADSTGNQYVTLRTKYEVSKRTGSGFQPHLLEEVGEQPGMRHYDLADRDRHRYLTTASVTPTSFLNISASAGGGRDDYEESGFGLLDSDNRSWALGFDMTPRESITVGATYSNEKYQTVQRSRTANPPTATDQTFFDVRRDWTLDADDDVRTISAYAELTRLLPRTDLRLGYDFSDGDTTYVYNLAPNQTLFTTTPLRQLQPIRNEHKSTRFDLQHFIRPNVALGIGYNFEDYKVEDFALGSNTIDRFDPVNATTGAFASTLYTGYLFRPYTAHTWWVRTTYLW